jgi:hypothetical protein
VDEVEVEIDLRKVHDLWRGQWRNGTRKTRFYDGINEMTNEKQDDEECEEANDENKFDVDIIE